MKKFFTTIALLFFTASLSLAEHHKKPVALEGVWNAVAGSDNGERQFVVTLTRKDNALTGISHSVEREADRKIDRITVEGKKVTFEYDMERDGQKGLIKVIADEKAPGKLEGKWSVEGDDGVVQMSGPWRAEKEMKFDPIGEWDSVGTTDDGEEHSSKLVVSGSDADLKGAFAGEAGELEIDSVKLDGKKLNLAFVLDLEGNKVPTLIEAEAIDENTLKGKWIIKDASGEVAASGDWTAKRKMKPVFEIAGAWDVVAVLPEDAEYNGTLSIQKKGEKLSGSSKSDDGEARDLETVTFDGKNLVFTVGIEMDGQAGLITVTAVKEGDNGFKGRWSLTGPDNEEVAGDSWEAKRDKAAE